MIQRPLIPVGIVTVTLAERAPVRTIRIACVWPVPVDVGPVNVTLELVNATDVVLPKTASKIVEL